MKVQVVKSSVKDKSYVFVVVVFFNCTLKSCLAYVTQCSEEKLCT